MKVKVSEIVEKVIDVELPWYYTQFVEIDGDSYRIFGRVDEKLHFCMTLSDEEEGVSIDITVEKTKYSGPCFAPENEISKEEFFNVFDEAIESLRLDIDKLKMKS